MLALGLIAAALAAPASRPGAPQDREMDLALRGISATSIPPSPRFRSTSLPSRAGRRPRRRLGATAPGPRALSQHRLPGRGRAVGARTGRNAEPTGRRDGTRRGRPRFCSRCRRYGRRPLRAVERPHHGTWPHRARRHAWSRVRKVIDQVLVTSVKTRALTLDEIREKGIVLDSERLPRLRVQPRDDARVEAGRAEVPGRLDRRGVALPQPLLPPPFLTGRGWRPRSCPCCSRPSRSPSPCPAAARGRRSR